MKSKKKFGDGSFHDIMINFLLFEFFGKLQKSDVEVTQIVLHKKLALTEDVLILALHRVHVSLVRNAKCWITHQFVSKSVNVKNNRIVLLMLSVMDATASLVRYFYY